MPELAGALRRHRLPSTFSSDADLVFCSDTGRTIGHRNLTARGLDRATKHSGLDGVTFHVLRHTFASILIDQDTTSCSSRVSSGTPTRRSRSRSTPIFDAERHADAARRQLEAEYGPLILSSRRTRVTDTGRP